MTAVSILFLILAILSGLYLFAIFPRLSMKHRTSAFCRTQFAHRGYHCASRYIPENSMPAFKAAVSHGYGIELDLHLTKDGKLVVFHDDTLDRICGVSGLVESFTYDQLRQFRLLGTDERMPLFSDVLSYVEGRVPLLIELKMPSKSLNVCEATYRELQHYHGSYLVQSFNTLALRWFRLHAPQVLRGQLSSNLTADQAPEPLLVRFFVKHLLINFLGRPDFISYKLKDLPEPGVFLCHRLFRIPVAVWTLRSERALNTGILHYDMQIFEKIGENY